MNENIHADNEERIKMNIKDLKKELEKRKKELKAFDKLSHEEKELRTKLGLNPYEPMKVRQKKRKAELDRRKKEFSEMPIERRNVLTSLGLNPYDEEESYISRVTGTIKAK